VAPPKHAAVAPVAGSRTDSGAPRWTASTWARLLTPADLGRRRSLRRWPRWRAQRRAHARNRRRSSSHPAAARRFCRSSRARASDSRGWRPHRRASDSARTGRRAIWRAYPPTYRLAGAEVEAAVCRRNPRPGPRRAARGRGCSYERRRAGTLRAPCARSRSPPTLSNAQLSGACARRADGISRGLSKGAPRLRRRVEAVLSGGDFTTWRTD
jgi:hypothetical protein